MANFEALYDLLFQPSHQLSLCIDDDELAEMVYEEFIGMDIDKKIQISLQHLCFCESCQLKYKEFSTYFQTWVEM